MKKIKKITILLLAAMLATTGFRCKFQPTEVQQKLKPITLNYWRAWDDTEDFSQIINEYRAIHPNININYRKLRYEEYEKELLEAWAEDRGPDIFSVRNTWVRAYESKISPLPKEISMAYQRTEKSLGIKEETVVEIKKQKSITPAEIKLNFLDVVYKDAVIGSEIYGLPLSVDTLVMFYNRGLLNNAGISLAAGDWRQFQTDVKKISLLSRDNNIIQAGTALGTGKNVLHAFDIISLLMMQNGAVMADTAGNPTFHSIPPGSSSNYNPGIEATKFYTDFASPSKEVYSWNSNMTNSRQAFARGLVGYYFGYSSDIEYIERDSRGKLNYGITNMPQIEGNTEVNIANYWLETVSKKSKYQNEAWDFIQFMTQAKNVKSYLGSAARPTALRALIDEQKSNGNMAIFASQLLTTKTWYQGKKAAEAEEIFKEMADSIVKGEDPNKAVPFAAQRVSQTIR
ncbi:extracellular solute-binding protein [Candidatus Parcubacteria bacterium]|nr:MAG: extracellular solute-binding protein [Candidatus Parcubacteria bacterium]